MARASSPAALPEPGEDHGCGFAHAGRNIEKIRPSCFGQTALIVICSEIRVDRISVCLIEEVAILHFWLPVSLYLYNHGLGRELPCPPRYSLPSVRRTEFRENRHAVSKKHFSKRSMTDWKRLDALRDEDIDLSENPELTPEMFAHGIVRRGLKTPPRKRQLTLRIDEDVLEWFRARGPGYQTRINALLRAYVEAHRSR